MKKPEYAAGTTAIYRKYIDRFYTWDAAGRKEPWKIDSKDRQHLLSLYIRKELSCGYYEKRNGADMVTRKLFLYRESLPRSSSQFRRNPALRYG